MIIYDLINKLRNIEDNSLVESIIDGYLVIYENNEPSDTSIIDNLNYIDALHEMSQYFNSIKNDLQYIDKLEIFTITLFRKYQEYQKKISDILDNISDDNLKLIMNLVDNLKNYLTGNESIEEYRSIIDNIELYITLTGSEETFVFLFNTLIKSEIFNALLHRIKDFIVPGLKKT
jgi:uncharacterized protein YeeX (DUF496 family)